MLLICDEAYLMIDQKVPQSLVYLRNVMKRARKYEGALAIISHSIVDFPFIVHLLSSPISMFVGGCWETVRLKPLSLSSRNTVITRRLAFMTQIISMEAVSPMRV